ncbi:putative signal transducing protein [Thermoflavifilum thermophilum]|uniref:Putative signal transducing protein n=1 Tax=Thermoflavifilum thermophilum TaxID=1393122 RepID=A0A1I7N8D1_9BACT|nr:DUF2007 domain-containing protein [Thermoflavifilum thermophilum]SFV30843.1 Putative signal transducing protein [Thermoflavifilum thermophilum]
METEWVKIYSTRQSYEAALIQGMLKEHGIESVIMNRQDSEFLVGEIHLYVYQSDAEQARKLIEETREK